MTHAYINVTDTAAAVGSLVGITQVYSNNVEQVLTAYYTSHGYVFEITIGNFMGTHKRGSLPSPELWKLTYQEVQQLLSKIF